MEVWIGIIGTITGVVAAWILGQASETLSARRKSRCDLTAASFICLDRLLKIKSAHLRALGDQVEKEFWHLGADMDRYLHCIASSPSKRAPHWSVYRKMIVVLQQHDIEKIDTIVAELEAVSDVDNIALAR